MENPRPEKVAVVNEVRERLSSSGGAILTEYRGLNVSDLATLRRSLREAGGQYKIYKNTLVRFAVRELGLTDLEEMLLGPTAIAFVDGDAASVAKSLRDFARGNPALVIKGGVLGEAILSAKDAAALAELPSREQLLAQLAGAMAAPLQQMAGLLKALPQNFAYALRAVAEQKGGPVDLDSPPEPKAAAADEPVSIPDHPGVSPAPDETENPPDFEGESPPSGLDLPESPVPDETAKPPEAEMTEPPAEEDTAGGAGQENSADSEGEQ
ncbi:MAG TPA: 50S ribosomal protein L10 [Acidimicrobiales bacterium]|nr:50S ribosomal protein L10 [Acidimicrobiales bacterium]